MTTNELNRFRAILETRITELERSLGSRDGITVERSPDQLDDTLRAAERALAVLHLDRNSRHLQSARAARRRIREGTFGICQGCEEEIYGKRLAAVPWALYCLRCQEAADHDSTQPGVRAYDSFEKAA
jgi:DnaK suppressor protein